MSEKFADLFPAIRDDETFEFTRAELNGVRVALQWLDEKRSLAPRPTITRDELSRVIDDASGANLFEVIRNVVEEIGVEVVEPTNAEKWKTFCEGLGISLEPWQVDYISRHMDEAGVIAP